MDEVEQFLHEALLRRAFMNGLAERGTGAINPYVEPATKAAWNDGAGVCPECDGLTYIKEDGPEISCPVCCSKMYEEERRDRAAGF